MLSKHLVLALWLLNSTLSIADPVPTPGQAPLKALERCQKALNACDDLVYAQDESITHLKEHVRVLEDKLADTAPSTTPTWAIIAVSGLAGLLLGVSIK